jgi:hypothetical protein
MALVSLGGCQPTMLIGGILSVSGIPTTTTTATTLDAANEAVIYIGHMWWEDGGSHTVDTSGSSSLNWRTTTVTFANAGTRVKVGLADVVNAAGPPARAVNVSDVITFDVWARAGTGQPRPRGAAALCPHPPSAWGVINENHNALWPMPSMQRSRKTN